MMAPAFLKGASWLHPDISWGDAFDLLTPLVLLPLYWRLLQAAGERPPGAPWTLAFLVLAALWVEGQGMHLAANSIGHLLKSTPEHAASSVTHYYDEVLSHYLWHAGVVGLAALLFLRDLERGTKSRPGLAVLLGAVVYGFAFFVITVEGATTPLGVPAALLLVVLGLLQGPHALKGRVQTAFWTWGHAVALLFYTGWGVYWRGLPEFSAVGIID